MAESYYLPDTIRHIHDLRNARPELMQKFQEFDQAVFAEGAIPIKYKQLMAITAAHITQCPFCIDAHVWGAVQAGATDEEIAEAVFVAMAMRAGGAETHGTIAMKVAHEQREHS